jgi:anti-sigma B factor antagonist
MTMTDVRYPVVVAGGVPVVAAPQEIDITNAAGLREVLLDLIPGHAAVVIDMTQTQFCDTAGLHVLVMAHKRALTEGCQVRLAMPGGPVLRILTITGIDRVIPRFTSLEDALAAPAAPAGRRPPTG